MFEAIITTIRPLLVRILRSVSDDLFFGEYLSLTHTSAVLGICNIHILKTKLFTDGLYRYLNKHLNDSNQITYESVISAASHGRIVAARKVSSATSVSLPSLTDQEGGREGGRERARMG